jgi:hypothetical protein
MIDFQSSATGLLLCPFRTFENSPAIYGWVHHPQETPSPEGTIEILPGLPDLKCRICAHPLVALKLCEGGCPSMVKNHEIAKRTQSSMQAQNAFVPARQTRKRLGRSGYAYYRLLSPNDAYLRRFPGKKRLFIYYPSRFPHPHDDQTGQS